jgi:hypothetical protein
MKNKEKVKNALEAFYATQNNLLIEISSTLVTIENSLSEIDLTAEKSTSKYYALQKRKEFAIKILSFFDITGKAMSAMQEYIRYLEAIEKDKEKQENASELLKKITGISVAKHLIANGMSDADVQYCLNLRKNA